jgi:hypothetical protein
VQAPMTIGVFLETRKAGDDSGLWEMVVRRRPRYNQISEDMGGWLASSADAAMIWPDWQ